MKNVFLLCAFLLFLLTAGNVNAQDNQQPESQATDEKVYKMNEVDKKPDITKKPHPRTGGTCASDTGLTRLRLTFHKTGKITDVSIVQLSGCGYFDESSLKAAQKMKFKPAIKDGQEVSVTTLVEYEYRTY